MSIFSYIWGSLRYLGRRRVSVRVRVAPGSKVDISAVVGRFAKVYNAELGRHTYVGPGTHIVNASVGSFCSIAEGCRIGLASHTMGYISSSPIFTERNNGTRTRWVSRDVNAAHTRRVTIGNDVWIGTRAIIKSGVNIGHGAVIGAGAIITHDVPPYAVVAGVPAKVIKYRFPEAVIQALLELEWWNFNDEFLKENIEKFQDEVQLSVIQQFTPPTSG